MDNYIKLKSFRDGHAYYIQRSTGRVVVADMGRYDSMNVDRGPEHRDDGVLYLNFQHDISAYDSKWVHETYCVPVVDKSGWDFVVSISDSERQWLKFTFNW